MTEQQVQREETACLKRTEILRQSLQGKPKLTFLNKDNVFNNSLLLCRLVGIFSKAVRYLSSLLLSEIQKKIKALEGHF